MGDLTLVAKAAGSAVSLLLNLEKAFEKLARPAIRSLVETGLSCVNEVLGDVTLGECIIVMAAEKLARVPIRSLAETGLAWSKDDLGDVILGEAMGEKLARVPTGLA